jgi:hypothetical protein
LLDRAYFWNLAEQLAACTPSLMHTRGVDTVTASRNFGFDTTTASPTMLAKVMTVRWGVVTAFVSAN